MKNRIICLALCLLFVLSAGLTGCKEKTSEEMIDNITAEASANTKTLSMWVVTEAALADGVKKAVNDAVNEITTSKFNTYLFINFLTEDEYYKTVKDEISAYEDSKSAFAPATEVVEGDPIIVGDNQFAKHYPALRAHQVDIVYISGEDMYAEYVEKGWLSSLDSELSASSKKIKEHLSATLMEAAKIQKGTYAIPNNKALGEYTYMLLDKTLMDESYITGIYKQGKINGFFNDYIFNYLDTVHYKNANNAEGEVDILPISASYDDCLELLAHYWSVDPATYEAQNDQFSILGYRYTDPKTLSKGKTILSFDSLFADETFCENFVKLNEYRMDGNYFGESENAAVRFVTGDYSDYDMYLNGTPSEENPDAGRYYPVIVKYPTIDVEDVFESMFGVCSYTVDLSASMQIITYLNTNADFRNLLQYGVEGEHYKLSEDGKVERLEDEENNPLYNMDIYKTGNAFIAYPEPSMNEDVWEVAKKQNREVLLNPLLGFDFAALVEKSGAAAASDVKVGSSGYVYTYESGYSKDVASQNELLKKWIDASDLAGKGVYVLHSGVLNGQNFTGKIYYYNNDISNAKVTVTDGNGELSVNYQGTVGGGSDLTVITFNGKRSSSNLKWNAKVNDAAVETAVTYQNSVLNFDFFKTESYTVDFDANVTKAMVLENDVIWNWIYRTTHDANKLNVAAYAAPVEGKEGVYRYTYVGYLPTIEKKYTITMQPTVNGTELNLNVNYTTGTAALGETDAKYALFVVNVELQAPMTNLNVNVTMDGNVVGEDKTVVQILDSDPRLALSGTLDVELVKYIDALNVKINAALEACTSIDAFKKLVDDLHLLLTPKTVDQIYAIDGVAFDTFQTKAVQDLVAELDAQEFYRALACATNSGKVVHKALDENGEKLVEVSKINEIYSSQYQDVTEFYHYYVSPYALYFNWLKENGYTK